MTTAKVWSSRDGQGYFGFDMIVEAADKVVSEVRTMKRFNQDSSWHAVSYESWLAWFSPLRSSGIRVRELENCTVFEPAHN